MPPKTARRISDDPELKALYVRVGEQVRRLREAEEVRRGKRFTQGDAAEEIWGKRGAQSNWSRMERGVSLPNIASFYKITKFFGVSFGELGFYQLPAEKSRPTIEAALAHFRKGMELLGGGDQ